MDIWTISAEEISHLQGRDPEFTAIMNELLRASTAGALPPTALRLNLKTHAPDGGIDAAADGSIPADHDAMKLFASATCWQFKACPSDHIKPPKGQTGGQEVALRSEMQKPLARQLIAQEYGYRFCLTDSLTPERREKWEGWLLHEARTVNPNAAAPIVLSADLLADWCSRHPGIVRRLRPFLSAVHEFQAWDRAESALVPRFVSIESREPALTAIRQFVDFNQSVPQPVLTVSGEAGVGKSRCALEALRGVYGIGALLIMTDSEVAAVDTIHWLMNEPNSRAVVVTDGMDIAGRDKVSRMLVAHAHRLRVIAIDHDRHEEAVPEGEIRLGRLGRQDIERILGANFPDIPNEQRWAIAELADGFVRLAVDVCRHIHLLPARGELAALAPLIRDEYLAARLSPQQRTVVELVSLLARVAYRGEPAAELKALCAGCPGAGMTAEQVVASAIDMRHAPGFIAAGPRYLYVTPRVIAQAAFRSAWDRWVRPNPEGFLKALTADMEDALCRQLRDAGTPEARRLLTGLHEAWMRELEPAALLQSETMYRVLRLAEVEPETVLPRLCDLVESTTPEQVAMLDHLFHPRRAGHGGWAARRHLVWLAEWMLRFAEFYPFAERILFRLAMSETESCGNNATTIWCQSYRPLLSGTPISFAHRLSQLEGRLKGASSEAELRLCLRALKEPLTADAPAHRMGSPSLIAGRMPPPDWIPMTEGDLQGVWRLTMDLVSRLAQVEDKKAEGVIDLVIEHGFGPLRNGYVQDFIRIVESRPIGEARLAALLHFIDRFLEVYCNSARRHASVQLETVLRGWKQRLLPTSLQGRLRVTLRRTYHDIYFHDSDHGEALLSGLAGELLADPKLLTAQLPWLYTNEACASHALGVHLGRLDESAGLLDQLVRAAVNQPNKGLARAYVVGLLERHPRYADQVSALLDQLTAIDPVLVFEFLATGIPSLHPLRRAFELVDAGRIPAAYLREVWRLVDRPLLTWDELHATLTRLLPAIRDADPIASQGAVDLLSMQVHTSRQSRTDAPAFGSEAVPLVRDILEASLSCNLGQQGYAWGDVVAELGKVDPESAIRLAVAALLTDNHLWLSDEIERYLTEAARHHPQAVMDALGAGLLTPSISWRLGLHELKPVVAALPQPKVRAWVEEHGLPAGRAIARLLPAPELRDGIPVVPELTEFILDRFGQDGRMFAEFCAGVDSGGWRSGDIAEQYDHDAEGARHFLTHRCRWIREWANRAEQSARAHADWFRTDDEDIQAP